MERFLIKGGKPLKGSIRVRGAKNAALKFLAASLLTDQPWVLSNVPQIIDVFNLIRLLKDVGAEVKELAQRTYQIQTKQIKQKQLDPSIAQKLKGSILMSVPLLVRQGEAFLPHPGGCVIGQRPRDLFVDGFKSFGVKVKASSRGYHFRAGKIKGTKFVFPLISVTATETMMLMAVLAEGKSRLVNVACEPEVVALAEFLNQCGAKIKGAGTSILEIEGVKSIKAGQAQIIPDRLEAGSFVILALATQSPLKITHFQPKHLEAFWALLKKSGAHWEMGRDWINLKPPFGLKAVNIKTHEYPGFPTDLQAPFTVLMTQAQGTCLIHETIFEGRLFYTDILNQMGAKIIICDPHRVVVQGPTPLYGRHLLSPDIRAGMALLIAALTAKGESIIENIWQIDRGYERIEERLRRVGADIQRLA